jgi:hypothetical protein
MVTSPRIAASCHHPPAACLGILFDMMEAVRARRLFLLVLPVLLLATGCRLDVDIAVSMAADGSGTLSVRAVADAELVDAAPAAIERLLVDDLVEDGWTVDGPTINDDGGATVVLTHRFDDDTDLTALMQAIGPPIINPSVTRELTADDVGRIVAADTTVTATLGLPDGFGAFADPELVSVLGGQPFAADLDGRSPGDVMSVDLTIALPDTSSDGDEKIETFTAPLDGSTIDISMTAQQRTERPRSVADVVATVLAVVLVLWVIASVSFIAWVLMARRKRFG